MDYDTILCDTCLIEVDCTWPCELACILDLPVDFVGRTCPVCLEYYGCQGCKFLCPYLETLSPTSMPSFKPTPPQTVARRPVALLRLHSRKQKLCGWMDKSARALLLRQRRCFPPNPPLAARVAASAVG